MAITVVEKRLLAVGTVRHMADMRATMQGKIRLSRVRRGMVARHTVRPMVLRITGTPRALKRRADSPTAA